MGWTVGVVSDTHGLLRTELVRALAGTDLIIHAGDIGGEDVLEALRAVGPTHAVLGNCDSPALGLPPATVVEVGPALLYVLHDLGRLDLDPRAAGFAAVVSGHSHCPAVDHRDGVLYLNPGSAGPRRFSLPISMARVHVDDAGQLGAELVELVP